MNKRKVLLLAAGLLLAVAQFSAVYAEKVKKLEFLQDDLQLPFVSKIYTLKYVRAVDLTPFILGAVKRYNINSTVERLNFFEAKKQLLLVSTPPAMLAYVDEMIKYLDCPGGIPDNAGSVIDGTGVFRYAYLPKHRSTDGMVAVLNAGVRDNVGIVYRDPVSNIIYWKDAPGSGMTILAWAKAFDRPSPQVELEFKVYEVRTSVLDDVGVDYLAWKNGPGLNLFQAGLESVSFQSVEKFLSNIDQFSSFSYGGFFVAPQFDLSFVRALSQSGLAKVSSAGSLTVVNNYTRTYNVKISPQMQDIEKDSSDKTAVVIGGPADFALSVTKPIICFKTHGEKNQVYNGDAFDQVTYNKTCGTIQFGYVLSINNVVERNNRGTELLEGSTISSSLTFEICHEQLLGCFNQTQKVEQTIGMPFLSDIPYLKYLFSTTTTIDSDTKVFVTVTGRLVHPEDSYAKWTGKLLTEADFPAIQIFNEKDK